MYNFLYNMMSSNGNIFRVTGHLCGEFTGHWLIPCTKASDAELWCFLGSVLNKRLSKQWWGWWFEMPLCPLWCHCNEKLHCWCHGIVGLGQYWLWMWLVTCLAPSHFPNQSWMFLNLTVRNKFHEIVIDMQTFLKWKCLWKCCLQNIGHFAPASMC